MTNLVPQRYLQETHELAKNTRIAFLELGKRLHRIYVEELWKGLHDSYEDFLEEIGLSVAEASKLRKIYSRFKEVSPVKLAEVGSMTKLYAIASRVEDDEVALSLVGKAAVLTKRDLEDEIREILNGENHKCEGDKVEFLICRTCKKWTRV